MADFTVVTTPTIVLSSTGSSITPSNLLSLLYIDPLDPSNNTRVEIAGFRDTVQNYQQGKTITLPPASVNTGSETAPSTGEVDIVLRPLDGSCFEIDSEIFTLTNIFLEEGPGNGDGDLICNPVTLIYDGDTLNVGDQLQAQSIVDNLANQTPTVTVYLNKQEVNGTIPLEYFREEDVKLSQDIGCQTPSPIGWYVYKLDELNAAGGYWDGTTLQWRLIISTGIGIG